MSNIETNVIKPDIRFFENNNEYLVITPTYESVLDSKISAIEDFMKIDGKTKTDEEKDELYKGAQELWAEYANTMRGTKYNFNLNRPQYMFLTNLILNKMEYDVNTVFFAIELTNLLASMKDVKFSDDKELVGYPVNATEITYIYHLISTHKVKGLNNDAYRFSEVLKRIGDISKLFNYYDNVGKNLSTDIQDWVASFEAGVTIEGKVELETSVEGTVVEPSK